MTLLELSRHCTAFSSGENSSSTGRSDSRQLCLSNSSTLVWNKIRKAKPLCVGAPPTRFTNPSISNYSPQCNQSKVDKDRSSLVIRSSFVSNMTTCLPNTGGTTQSPGDAERSNKNNKNHTKITPTHRKNVTPNTSSIPSVLPNVRDFDDPLFPSFRDLTLSNELIKRIRHSAGCHYIGDNSIDLNCENFQTTSKILPRLGLGEKLNWRASRCYCPKCCMSQGYRNVGKISRGVPVSIASLPFGWSRYALHVDEDISDLISSWHVSYHGTTLESLRMIVKDGCLKVPDNREVFVREGHIPDLFYIFTSPSVIYAGFGLYASPFK
ncbi:hypothetical protein IE077_000640, partial [Cardiosporidium cionae]